MLRYDRYLPIVGILSLLACWQLVIWGFDVRPFVAPSPGSVLRELWLERQLLFQNLIPTAIVAVFGFFLGNLVAVFLAIAFVHSDLVKRTYFPVVLLFNTIPIIALSPVLILIFGLSATSKILIAAVICFFPTLVNTIRGFESVSLSELELMQVLSASRREVFFKVRLPRSMPFLFSALRIACTASVIGAIVSEWIGSDSGLGVLIIQSTFEYRAELLYAAISVSSALAVTMFVAVVGIEKILVRWRTV